MCSVDECAVHADFVVGGRISATDGGLAEIIGTAVKAAVGSVTSLANIASVPLEIGLLQALQSRRTKDEHGSSSAHRIPRAAHR